MRPAPNGGHEYELRKARPEGAASTLLLKFDSRRLPYDSMFSALDGPLARWPKWLAFVMMDGATANLWKLSTDGGEAQRITDFGGDRATWIVRQITWAGPDGKFIYGAIADLDADVVSIAGVVGAKAK